MAGLDQHQVRLWHSFHRHTVLSMCAQALLAVAAARPDPASAPGEPPPDDAPAAQPAAWADTGKLPVTAHDAPPGSDPGMVKVSVPEARRLSRLATAPMASAARQLGYAWSRWRRRHQARARWHYHTQLKTAYATLTKGRGKGGWHVTNPDCSTGLDVLVLLRFSGYSDARSFLRVRGPGPGLMRSGDSRLPG